MDTGSKVDITLSDIPSVSIEATGSSVIASEAADRYELVSSGTYFYVDSVLDLPIESFRHTWVQH